MKLKKFKKAVTKTYTETEITQARGRFFRKSRFKGVEKIEEVCPICAALFNLGYDLDELVYGNIESFYDIVRQEFNMTDNQLTRIFQMNDDEELSWEEILKRLENET